MIGEFFALVQVAFAIVFVFLVCALALIGAFCLAAFLFHFGEFLSMVLRTWRKR